MCADDHDDSLISLVFQRWADEIGRSAALLRRRNSLLVHRDLMLTSILTVPVRDDFSMTFIPQDELYELGYTGLQTFDVVEANGRFFEVQGYDKRSGLWWVEEIVVPNHQPEYGGDHPFQTSPGSNGSETEQGT